MIFVFFVIIVLLWFKSGEPAAAVLEPYFPLEDRMNLPDFPRLEDAKLQLFIDSTGIMYVLNLSDASFYRLSLDGQMLGKYYLEIDFIPQGEVGFYVNEKRIYLKLPGDSEIICFDLIGQIERRIQLQYPQIESANFHGIAVDPRGYIYTVERLNGRVLVFDADGQFDGTIAKVGGRQEDLRGLPENIYIDNEGNIHITVRLAGNNAGQIVKYSYQGRLEQVFMEYPLRSYSKIVVDHIGNVFAIDPNNFSVVKFDRRGRPICRFRTRVIASIAVDNEGRVYLDNGQSGAVDIMFPSQMVQEVDLGNEAFLEKDWEKAEKHFLRALEFHNQAEFVHLALGEIYFLQQRWLKAMSEFKYINDQWRYSQSLTGFRYYILVNYWFYILMGLVGVIILIYMIRRRVARIKLGFISYLRVIWAPIDTFKDAVLQPRPFKACAMVLIFVCTSYFSWYITNPIFIGEKQVYSLQLFATRLCYILLLAGLWAWTAYKVGELFQGMAKSLSTMITGSAICLVPLIVFQPILALASHLLTYNELWVYKWSGWLLIAWVVSLVWIKIRYTEDFSWSKAFGIGLANIGVSLLILCFLAFVVGINQQLYGFLSDLYNEVYNRLTT